MPNFHIGINIFVILKSYAAQIASLREKMFFSED